MIRSIILVMFLFCSFFKAYSFFQPNKDADSCFCKIEVLEIHKKKNAYIIYSRIDTDSSLIAIVSFKKRCEKGEKIEIGKKYTIRIYPYFKDNIVPNHSILFVVIKDGKKVNVPSTGWMSNVYTSPNLVGLRICTKQPRCLEDLEPD